MSKNVKSAISPTREENYSEWYQQVIKAADMAENSVVRGCMIIKPWGYAIWENIQGILDKKFKETGHKNAYFPLFIPLSYLEKEAKHVEGFAKECAVVTHTRLEAGADGSLVPASPLEEPLVVRPTSETIIGEAFAKWIQSYRDLPLKINQWANVVRWEMRTRLFLRTTEFLWQEGHTAHATAEDAMGETKMMLGVYVDMCENYMAMPVIQGEKSESERFPGADHTFCIEAMMQDRKALQAGTSHFLGQNFSKSQNIKFLNNQEQEEFAWTTSWGASTRLIGGLIMTHSDDDGLVLPPKIAPLHIVILPVLHKEETKATVLDYCEKLKSSIEGISFDDKAIRVEIDSRDLRGGEKSWQWIKKGVPIRIEVGPRDIAEDSLFMGRRDQDSSSKSAIKRVDFLEELPTLLQNIQDTLFNKALKFRENNIKKIDNKEEFYEYFNNDQGGFAYVHWNGKAEVEAKIKEDLKVTLRCIPLDGDKSPGKCVITGEPSSQRAYFARSY